MKSSKGLTSNQLKIIAMAAMFFDHFFAVFSSRNTIVGMFLRVPGRIVAPSMCFIIAESYYYTSDRKKYIFRLIILAVISHIPYNICFGYTLSPTHATSVIWALAMGLIGLTVLQSKNIHIVIKPIIMWVCCVAAITANWNYVAVLWIMGFGLFRGNIKHQIASFSVIGVLFHLLPAFYRSFFNPAILTHWFQLGIFLAIPLLLLYNGKLGKKSKALSLSFYVFYPAHLILIYLLNTLTPLSDVLRWLN